jgi:hypothetical protein
MGLRNPESGATGESVETVDQSNPNYGVTVTRVELFTLVRRYRAIIVVAPG